MLAIQTLLLAFFVYLIYEKKKKMISISVQQEKNISPKKNSE